MIYYARCNKDRSEYQTIQEHSEAVAWLCQQYAHHFSTENVGMTIGKYHDIGKYSLEFQQRIRGQEIKGPHALAGAIECERQYQATKNLLYRLMAYCISGHHSGLPNFGTINGMDSDLARKLKTPDRYISNYGYWKEEIFFEELTQEDLQPLTKKMEKNEPYEFILKMYTRFLFSCLVDADRMNSQSFEEQFILKKSTDQKTLDQMLDDFTKYIEKFHKEKGKNSNVSSINKIRNGILQDCMNAAQEEKGIFTLSVPTGGGKTISSLAFALHHAREHGMDRVIYSIPYNSIIEQNSMVYADIVGRESILEYHCNFENPYNQNNIKEEEYEKYRKFLLAQENFDMPLIVTTNVQLFESMFSNKPSRVRKLHNYANSIIILDEAQAIPNTFIKPCMLALQELVKRYGCTAVLCTATQPEFEKNNIFLPSTKTSEIIKNKKGLFNSLKRVKGEFVGVQTVDQIGNLCNQSDQVLCIVNTKKHALALYNRLEGEEGCFYLTTNLHAKHRRKIISQIKHRLKENLPCRVISTQLIEAGVDIDFPVVFRALTGIDSVVQAGGRCNREGKLKDATVYVFEPEEEFYGIGYLKTTADIGKLIIKQYKDFLSPTAISAYFRQLFDMSGNNLDKENILKEDKQNLINLAFDFKDISDRFKLIDSQGYSLVICNDLEDDDKENPEVIKLLEQAKFVDSLGGILRKLSPFSINVRRETLNRLDELNAIKLVEESILVLQDLQFYNKKTGLCLEKEPNDLDYII